MLRELLKPRTVYALSAIRQVTNTSETSLTNPNRIQKLHHDGIDLKKQSVETNPIEHIRRCTFYKDLDIWTLYKTICPNVRTLGDTLYEGCIASNDGPCVGILQPSNIKEPIQWLSYSMVIERSRIIGSYLWTAGKLIPMQSKVAVMSANRAEYLVIEQACFMYGFTVVNLYTSYNSTTVMNLLRRTQAEILVVDSVERIQLLKDDLLHNNQVKKIIVMDDLVCETQSKIQSMPSILKTMATNDIRERPLIDPNTIALFIMTSGTTG